MKNLVYFNLLIATIIYSCGQSTVHTWEKVELNFIMENVYQNPYTDVDLWVELSGPDFNKKIYGFWDGGKKYKVRVMATRPGEWKWRSFTNTDDKGALNKSGSFKAIDWTEEEKNKNPNKRGIIKTNPNAGHGFIYPDGTPFFLLADTWWAAFTWRYPFEGKMIDHKSAPDSINWCFEQGISWLKQNGFNSIAAIACFPNWKNDNLDRTIYDDAGIQIRSGWPKAPDGEKIKDMADEDDNMPFAFPGKCEGKQELCANFDLINPVYWQNMDKKMDHLWEQGFVPYIETIRRSHYKAWKIYHNFNESFSRYLNYLKARYGTYNFIYSLTHNDGVLEGEGKDGFIHNAIKYYHEKYGGMPFEQPVTAMMSRSSMEHLGHVDESPFLTCHSVGNWQRDHTIYKMVEDIFNSHPQVPCFSNEPYYSWHDVSFGRPDGEKVIPNSERDNYFARAHAYGHVFSGALGGHVFGSGSFGGDTKGEPKYEVPPKWPKIWQTLQMDNVKQTKYLKEFIFSEDIKYQELELASHDLSNPRTAAIKMDEWAYMLRSPDKKLALLYFEDKTKIQIVSGLIPQKEYKSIWFNPRSGEWFPAGEGTLKTDREGTVHLPDFPGGKTVSDTDWALKLKRIKSG
jgi:hypothetical protein